MTTDFSPSPASHPSLALLVTPEQRQRAESFLQEAYADGRLTHAEFTARLETVLTAQNRRELNGAFLGLVSVPPTSAALGLHPAYRPTLMNQGATGRSGKAMGAMAHFSALFFSFFGPMVMFLIAGEKTFAKRQAAKSFNFQIQTMAVFAAVVVLNIVTHGTFDWMFPVGALGWFGLTLVHGLKASQGEEWANPVGKVVRIKPLTEK